MIKLQLFAAPTGTVLSADLARVRNVDFVEQFAAGIQTLMKMLGTTRKIKKKDGEQLKAYTVVGTLHNGQVPEGTVVPLSHFETKYEPIGEAILRKWRKVTTAEAITEKGYEQAVDDTTRKMVRTAQSRVRTQFVNFAGSGTGAATGVGLQATLANVWGQLQVIWEDVDIECVYFLNPLDVAAYMGSAQITTQTAFGMTYIENFLGIGNVILASDIPVGKIYATASENIVLYYIPVNEQGMGQAFDLTSDETGLIGIHTAAVHNSFSVETVMASGVGLFAEQMGGIVVGTIAKGA